MRTYARSSGFLTALCVSMLAANMWAQGVEAAEGNKACELLTASEIESVLGATVVLNGAAPISGGKADICIGQAPTVTVMLRLVTGLDPGRDRSGSKEKAGMDMIKKMGGHVEVKTFGPIVCSTVEPPPGKEQMGYNTTCTVSKDTALAGIEVTVKNQKDVVPIEKVRPLAEKMSGRF